MFPEITNSGYLMMKHGLIEEEKLKFLCLVKINGFRLACQG